MSDPKLKLVGWVGGSQFYYRRVCKKLEETPFITFSHVISIVLICEGEPIVIPINKFTSVHPRRRRVTDTWIHCCHCLCV